MTPPRALACALDTVVIAAIGATERATRFLRSLTERNTCTCPHAVESFAALLHGSLEAEGLLRFSRHTSQCRPCKDLLVALIAAFGLRRVIHAGLNELVRTRTQA